MSRVCRLERLKNSEPSITEMLLYERSLQNEGHSNITEGSSEPSSPISLSVAMTCLASLANEGKLS